MASDPSLGSTCGRSASTIATSPSLRAGRALFVDLNRADVDSRCRVFRSSGAAARTSRSERATREQIQAASQSTLADAADCSGSGQLPEGWPLPTAALNPCIDRR